MKRPMPREVRHVILNSLILSGIFGFLLIDRFGDPTFYGMLPVLIATLGTFVFMSLTTDEPPPP